MIIPNIFVVRGDLCSKDRRWSINDIHAYADEDWTNKDTDLNVKLGMVIWIYHKKMFLVKVTTFQRQ